MQRILILLTTLGVMCACERTELDSNNQEADQKRLQEIRKEIDDMISGIPCEDAEGWDFTAIGSKACGGPKGYIAYPLSIDTEAFLALVEKYTKTEEVYNRKYGIISDCMAVVPPIDVQCQDGEPVLVYPELKVPADPTD